jgi:branched-chain amino acid transport system substrate-binding protein
MRTRRYWRAATILAVGALLLAVTVGCGSSSSGGGSSAAAAPSNGGSGKTINIGYVASESGWLAPFEDSFQKALQLGISEANQHGGIDGKYKVKLTMIDGKSEPAQAGIAANQLLNSSIMFGPCDMDAGLPAAQAAAAHKIPFISSCAGASDFTNIVKNYVYLSVPGTWAEGSAMAEWALKKGYKSAYLLYSKDIAYLQSVGTTFQTMYTRGGGKLVGTSVYKMNQPDYSTIIDKIANANPKPAFIAGVVITPDSLVMLKELAAANVHIPIMLTFGNETNLLLQPKDALKAVNAYILGLSPIPKAGTPLGNFFAAYHQKYGQQPDWSQAVNAGDDIAVLNAVMAKAQSTDPAKIQTAMQGLVNVKGLTGNITYSGQDGRPKKNFTVVRVTPDGFKFDDTFFPASVYSQ